MDACELLDCKIDYIATHEYLKVGAEQSTMNRLKAFSERYGGRKIWLTEFAVRNTHEENEIVGVIENLLPMQVLRPKILIHLLVRHASNIIFFSRLEEADYIWKYSWFITRYYPTPPDDTTNWWLDPANSLLDWDNENQSELKPILSKVGEAYDRPWHLYNKK